MIDKYEQQNRRLAPLLEKIAELSDDDLCILIGRLRNRAVIPNWFMLDHINSLGGDFTPETFGELCDWFRHYSGICDHISDLMPEWIGHYWDFVGECERTDISGYAVIFQPDEVQP